MKKYWLISLLLPVLMYWGCSEDTSAYLPQEKEDVLVDDVKPENGENEGDGDEKLPDGQLVIGMHQVKLNVPVGDSIYERKFKYYLPITIDETQPISLIFDFHGSYMFESGSEAPNPIANLSTSHPLVQHAIKNNCVVCFPAGTIEDNGSDEAAVNWQISEKHLPFVDAMIDYFKGCKPAIDVNRIYSTGQSSGAIFSFVLAFERSEVFAAITPRAGQMAIQEGAVFPSRCVPIRVFAGIDDKTVIHDAVIANMTKWAEKIGGYFPADMEYTEDSIEIENYKKVDTRIWKGGNADLQIYSLQDEGHNINEYYCMPYMWEFMAAHTLNDKSTSLFLTSEVKEFEAQCGEKVVLRFNHTTGATVFVENAPKGWTYEINGKELHLTAPKDFYANISRQGIFELCVENRGQKRSISIAYTLAAPKAYFEVGDIYFNKNFEPVGVVFWVNETNIREAKIVEIQGVPGKYASLPYCGMPKFPGLGLGCQTPSTTDGEGNTRIMVERNKELSVPFRASDALFMWTATYFYKNVGGWYLPAIDECVDLVANIGVVNNVIDQLGGVRIESSNPQVDLRLYSSTTKVVGGKKEIYYYNVNRASSDKSITDGKSEWIGWVSSRAIKKVSK